jgi:hypothetical protein
MKNWKQKNILAFVAIVAIFFGFIACGDTPGGDNGGNGSGTGTGNGTYKFPAEVNARNAFIAIELQRLSALCANPDFGHKHHDANHGHTLNMGDTPFDAPTYPIQYPNALQDFANIIAQCRLNDIRQINNEVFAERGVRVNIEGHGSFGLDQGWLLQNGQNATFSVSQRSNANNLGTPSFVTNNVNNLGGGFVVRELE